MLANALDATAACEQGCIHIWLDRAPHDHAYHQIRIQDNGGGIALDLQKKLFEPFDSGDGIKLGLGLTYYAKKVLMQSKSH